jgi:CheY-like chemotaxis protein/HPt (histidine-containing phosphotransfer) domain-containing protein
MDTNLIQQKGGYNMLLDTTLGKLKILVVEDIYINQFLAQIILDDFGFESDIAVNGKMAIELLEKNQYDIILMDLMMPEMDGFETTMYIRNKMQAPKSTIPIIALTADVTKTAVERCTEVGMDEYVSKPINETDLLNKITRLIKNTRKVKPAKSIETIEKKKISNLDYLKSHSPNNPKFINEMVGMILQQSPGYISEIKRCLANSDWDGFFGNVHKIRPTIDLIGMPQEVGIIAKQMEEYGKEHIHLDLIPAMFLKMENAFKEAYIELEEELEKLKSGTGNV